MRKDWLSNRCGSFVLALLLVAFSLSCRTREREQQQADVERRKQTSQAIAAMAASHSAVIDWEQRLEYPGYAVKLQDILSVKSGRKILFIATANDIDGSSGNFFCRFSTHGVVDIVFLLKCSDGQVKSILQHANEDWRGDRYAVVAEVSGISKPLFRADVESEDGDYADQQQLVIENDNAFVARGNCADLLFVGDYEPE